MINTRMKINGKMEEVHLFENMFEYVSYYGSDISYYAITKGGEDKFITEEEHLTDDSGMMINDPVIIDDIEYVRVRWGENGISFIKFDGVTQSLYSIYQKIADGVYQNYKSMFFESETEAQNKADELNSEE